MLSVIFFLTTSHTFILRCDYIFREVVLPEDGADVGRTDDDQDYGVYIMYKLPD
jgi:hypothetical protein